MQPKSRILSITALAAFGLAAGSAHGTIIHVSSGMIGGAAPPASGIVSSSIAVGAGADMLILMYAGEMGTGGLTTASYGGVPMVHAAGNRNHSAIFYLDLSTPGISGTTLAVDMSAWGTRNGHASGWVSIDGNLGAGESIALHSTAIGGSGSSTVNLVTSLETFNVISLNGNGVSGTVTVNSPNPTVVYTDNNIGSARAAAAYTAQIAAGSHIYEWTLTGGTLPDDYRQISAAAFAVVPEPSSTAMLGLGVLGLLLRRAAGRR